MNLNKLSLYSYSLVVVLWAVFVIGNQVGFLHTSKVMTILIGALVCVNGALQNYYAARDCKGDASRKKERTFYLVLMGILIFLGIGLVITTALGI